MPSGGALFGNSTGPGSTGGVKHLVEFRAGRMNLKGRMVYPDKRKGLLYIYQSEDSLMHFCWQDRHSGAVEDDLIIFPDDCEYVHVPQCTTGRAYVLKFKSSNRKLFFWMQEPRTDRDEDHCKRINEYLNNPPGGGNLPSNSTPDENLQSLLNNMSQSQLMQLFGGVGQMGGLSSLLGTMRPTGTRSGSSTTSSTTTPTTTASGASSNTTTTTATPASIASIASIASTELPATGTATTPTATVQSAAPVAAAATPTTAGLATPQAPQAPRAAPTTTTAAGGVGGVVGRQNSANPIQLFDLQNFLQRISTPDQQVDLSSSLTSDALSGILNSPAALEQLQNHLPAVDGTTQEQLRSTLTSPQFQQAVSQFSSALQSGQLGPVVSQLTVNQEAVAAATNGNMREFVAALEKSATATATATADKDKDEGSKSTSTTSSSGSAEKKDPKKDDDDEGMQLD